MCWVRKGCAELETPLIPSSCSCALPAMDYHPSSTLTCLHISILWTRPSRLQDLPLHTLITVDFLDIVCMYVDVYSYDQCTLKRTANKKRSNHAWTGIPFKWGRKRWRLYPQAITLKSLPTNECSIPWASLMPFQLHRNSRATYTVTTIFSSRWDGPSASRQPVRVCFWLDCLGQSPPCWYSRTSTVALCARKQTWWYPQIDPAPYQ